MKQFLLHPAVLVFVGGGAGSLLRYKLGQWIPTPSGNPSFPLAILAANVLASLLLGLIMGAFANRLVSNDARLLLGVGVCGGLSTFSSFSVDTLLLFQAGRPGLAMLNVGLNVAFCLLASAGGFWLASTNSFQS